MIIHLGDNSCVCPESDTAVDNAKALKGFK